MACDDSKDGFNSLVNVTDEAAGNNCPGGGVKVASGTDRNSNGVLDPDEVSSTKYVCDGAGPREVRIDFFFGGSTNSGTPGTTTDSTHPYTAKVYDDFDVTVYPGYDSIVYVVRNVAVYNMAAPPSSAPPGPVTDHNLTVELVDLTRDTVIPGSEMTVTTGPKYVSKNLLGKIPSGKIDLGIRMTSANPNYSGGAYPISLVLVDKN